MRSVFLSLAEPLRLSQSNQRCCNWHWLSVSWISTTTPPTPSSSPPQRPHIHYLHPGFLGPHSRGWPTLFGSVSFLLWHTHTHTYYTYTHSVYAHTRTLRYKERIILPGSSFSVSNLLSSSWLLWALSCELCYNEDIFEKKQTKTIKPHEVHWDSYFLIYMFYAPHQTKSLSWWN